MRTLKLLVAVMGALLVGGTAALFAIIVGRAGEHASAPARGFDRAVVELPPGASVIGTELGYERLLLRVRLPEGGEDLILIDPASGARLGTIELKPATGGEARQ